MVFHTASSACADFLFLLGHVARGNYCLTFMQRVTPFPKEHWKASSNAVQLPSCCTLITWEQGLLCCNSIKWDWRQSYNTTVPKISAVVAVFFPPCTL